MHSLIEIQKLQFSRQKEAEQQLLALLKSQFRDDIAELTLNPKPESLNSLNGFVTLNDGERYFFKTHTEENEKLSSYYNAQTLADAGYPVVTAKEVSSKPGQQIALYEIISFPTLFDLVKREEDELLKTGNLSGTAEDLVRLQKELDKQVCAAYKKTLRAADDEGEAPVHQLFYHRLAEGGRVDLFYNDGSAKVDGAEFSFDELKTLRWFVNGVAYDGTLQSLIADARERLLPRNKVTTVVGHGDAHNGNVFVDEANKRLLYFDPAFAGRHDPILDMAKPLFHNVFARWMYFPKEVDREIAISVRVESGAIHVTHNFVPSKLRVEFLRSKIQHALRPMIGELTKAGMDPDWILRLRSALFACSFLTVNLMADYKVDGSLAQRYPDAIRWLGLTMAVEMAALAQSGENEIKSLVDEIASVAQCTAKLMDGMSKSKRQVEEGRT